MRQFVIGDIHGRYYMYDGLIDKLSVNHNMDLNNDQLIFLGDYIDRGSGCYSVVQNIIELKDIYGDNVICLMGNHEQMLLHTCKNSPTVWNDQWLWINNGGDTTIKDYKSNGYILLDGKPDHHIKFFNELLPYYETDKYIFVHGGLEDIPLCDQDLDNILWIRETWIKSKYDHGKVVIFGHTPFKEPYIGFNKIGIDTGAGYNKTLTCLILDDGDLQFEQVHFKEVYCN